jgi:hypothetical protein
MGQGLMHLEFSRRLSMAAASRCAHDTDKWLKLHDYFLRRSIRRAEKQTRINIL